MLATMVVLVFGNVVLRYAFNSGITVSEELSRFLFVWLTFMGAVVGLMRRQHLGIDMLVHRLSRHGQLMCALVGELLMLLCCVLFVWGSLAQARINMATSAPVTGLPMAVIYAAGVVSGLLMSVFLVASILRIVTGRATAADLRLGQEEAGEVAEYAAAVGAAEPRRTT